MPLAHALRLSYPRLHSERLSEPLLCLPPRAAAGPAADIKVTTSDLRSQVGRIQNQVKEIQEVVRMYSSTTGPRRVRRQKVEVMSAEAVDTNVRSLRLIAAWPLRLLSRMRLRSPTRG